MYDRTLGFVSRGFVSPSYGSSHCRNADRLQEFPTLKITDCDRGREKNSRSGMILVSPIRLTFAGSARVYLKRAKTRKVGREHSVPMEVYRRALSSREAMSLTFFSSVPFIPKKVAISTICLSLTKSLGSEQNLSIVGPKSWQLMPFGLRRPSLHSPLEPQCEHNSQIIIFQSPRLKFGRYSC